MAVFIDFDGTVTVEDTCVHLLRRFARPGWEKIGQQYRAGRIDGRTCLKLEWEMLPHDIGVLSAVAAEIPLDPGLQPLLGYLAHSGAEVKVLSDGFGFFADQVMADRVPVITNRVVDGQLIFPYAVDGCPCGGCGICKPRFVTAAAARGLTTVVIGDGASDRPVSKVADVVFAKADLADWCAARDIEHIRFATLVDVRDNLRAAVRSVRATRNEG